MQNIVIIADRDWIGVSDMNVLEKILEEIDKKADYYETDEQGREHVRMVDMVDVEEIIRSHMGEKEKVTSAEIISEKIAGKTYYEIKYKNVGEDEYYIGYSSFNLDYVIEWLNGCFEFCGEAKVSCENDSWIPVEEGLPEVPEGLEDAYCPEFNVTIKGVTETTTLKYSWDGTWFDDGGNIYDVVAWQPLPERYKGGDDRA